MTIKGEISHIAVIRWGKCSPIPRTTSITTWESW